jgi:hypothetical protein
MVLGADLPTAAALAEAKRTLSDQHRELGRLDVDIASAEEALETLIRDGKRAIEDLKVQRSQVERRIEQTLAYVSPLRRLPHDMLRQIFLFTWEQHPCCAWVLAAVCITWRRMALSTPQLWSKVSPQNFHFLFSFCATSLVPL